MSSELDTILKTLTIDNLIDIQKPEEKKRKKFKLKYIYFIQCKKF